MTAWIGLCRHVIFSLTLLVCFLRSNPPRPAKATATSAARQVRPRPVVGVSGLAVSQLLQLRHDYASQRGADSAQGRSITKDLCLVNRAEALHAFSAQVTRQVLMIVELCCGKMSAKRKLLVFWKSIPWENLRTSSLVWILYIRRVSFAFLIEMEKQSCFVLI